jgi:gentisate 1,2-dioxygenase
MESLNGEAGHLHIWLRTQPNAPAQRPWFKATGVSDVGKTAEGRVGAAQMKAVPHLWRWREISPYLSRIAEIAKNAEVTPIEFADRQQFLLTNPGLDGRLQIAATMRCAVSIYNSGDIAPAHMHSPNASRTILSESGGYTNVEGERCAAERGDIILTPNGTWHDHGNDGEQPVIWIDTLDWPILEFLDCIWLDEDMPGNSGNIRRQEAVHPSDYSDRLYGHPGLLPAFLSHQRGIGHQTSPYIHYRGKDIVEALSALQYETGDPYEGISLRLVNPVTGGPLFPTLGYGAQLLRPGEETLGKRETSNTVYVVMDGQGQSEVGGRTFDWEKNDVFVVPNFVWRKHVNNSQAPAILYTMNDCPLFQRIGQYRAQGITADARVEQLAY